MTTRKQSTIANRARRKFMIGTAAAGGGLAIGLQMPFTANAAEAKAAAGAEVNAWVVVQPNNTCVIRIARSEMGQGTLTGLAQLVAEELDMDWSTIKTEWTPADTKYGNPNFGGQQLTAGSNSVRGMWKILRGAGATARAMLVTAAAHITRGQG